MGFSFNIDLDRNETYDSVPDPQDPKAEELYRRRVVFSAMVSSGSRMMDPVADLKPIIGTGPTALAAITDALRQVTFYGEPII